MNTNPQKVWRDTRFPRPDGKDIDNIMNGRRRTALQNLARRYRHMHMLSMLAIGFIAVPFGFSEFIPSGRRLVMCLSMAVYFGIAAGMDAWLAHTIGGIDCTTMSVSTVVGKARMCRRRHLQFMAVLIPLCLVLLGLFMWTLGYDRYMVWGMAGGAVTGLVMGLRLFLRFMADNRDLSE